MKLKDIWESKGDRQMILSIGNNNDVLVDKSMFIVGGKQNNMSRVRLNVDFEILEDSELSIYKTNRGRGKKDYIVFVSTDYNTIVSYRNRKKNNKIISSSKSKTTAIYPHIDCGNRWLEFTPYAENYSYWCKFKSNCFKEIVESNHHTQNTKYSRTGYYYAVMQGLLMAYKYSKKIDIVKIKVPRGQKGIVSYARGRYCNKNSFSFVYANDFNKIKKMLSDEGVTIEFVLED